MNGVVPVQLPPHLVPFLSTVLYLAPSLVQLSWVAFSDFAVVFHSDPSPMSMDDSFRRHGIAENLGVFVLHFVGNQLTQLPQGLNH